ncbi:glycine/D-amino acid oxidase-like deaminating enzyme [Trinickia symbiotica]|uniref:FAD-binding oxidoreductase n=1 Tax=Trinickia symbiotica TaxID=863227 RepID=A0A2N7WRR0_9BURK|nr:FAD-binding oxidoreductase [Trinickia symbiotica]PMS32148.1 FAD-binding oxidoreductase [Trinickia symbiotica]PPK41948.1 glycine/D-amino acid oxidase-like deaminating enzyme [Trinickia symbiotica]
MTISSPRVLIVGAGIIGAILAYDFSRRGARVTVLDRNERASGATAGSFAWITNQTKFRNADTLSEAGARDYFNLHRLSHLRWRHLQDEVKAKLPIRWCGCLQLAIPGTQQATELDAELQRRLRWGSPTFKVSAAEARELEPALHPGDETFITYTPDEGMMAPVQMTAAMLDEAIALGASYSANDAFASLQRTAGGYTVTSAKGKREADIVVFAGGIANPELAEQVGLKAPLVHSVGSVVHLAPLPPLFDKVVLGSHVHAIQRFDGRVVIAQHFSGSPVGDPSAPNPEQLVEVAAAILPGLKGAKVEKVTETRRVIPADGLPVFSRSDDNPGIAAITTNAGVSLGAILSQLIVTEMIDGLRVKLLDPYRAERFTA